MKAMKTIYKTSVFCAIAWLSLPMATVAQEDKSVSREMTLEREYAPSVQDANKINTLPDVKVPEVRKSTIDYSTFAVPAEPQREIGILPPGSIMTDMSYNNRRGYLNAGVGTLFHINGDLGYHILSTDKDQLNVFFTHRSTNGNIKFVQDPIDAKTKAKLNDNLGGINYRHVFSSLAFKIGANYNYSGFNYYGLSPRYFPSGNIIPEIKPENGETFVFENDTNQVNQTIHGFIGVESAADAAVGYLLDIDYTNFGQKYGSDTSVDGIKEHTARAVFDLNASFGGSQKVGLGGKAHYFTYSSSDWAVGNGFYRELSDNRLIGTLSPYYKAEGDNWNIKLGVNASFITKEDKKFVASPNIAMDVTTGGKTTLYLNAGGGPEVNSYYELSRRNRYVLRYETPATSRTWLDAVAGVKSGIVPGFWFDIFAGYKMTDDDCFFVYSSDYTGFGNTATTVSLDTKRLQAGASLKYAYQKLFEIRLKGVYYNWTVADVSIADNVTKEVKPYGRPEMEITAGFMICPFDPLKIEADYYLATGRYTTITNWEPLKMNNINELNVKASYALNDTFGFYVMANNVLFQKYELLYGYPLQRFSVMGGININF